MRSVFIFSSCSVLMGCMGAQGSSFKNLQCSAVDSSVVSDQDALVYDLAQTPRALLEGIEGPVALALHDASSAAFITSATLQLTINGPITAHDIDQASEPSNRWTYMASSGCQDHLTVPVHASLTTQDGLLNEAFDLVLRLDGTTAIHHEIRETEADVGGSVDLASAHAGAQQTFDRFDLQVDLTRSTDKVWTGALASVAVIEQAPVIEGCPNSDPDADIDCPTETDTSQVMYTLEASD